MADKLKPGDAGKRGVSSKDLRKSVDEINKHKKNASEHAGLSGKATSNAVEQFGLEKNALTQAAKMDHMEPAKRQAIMRSSIEYWDKLGFFD